MTRVEVVDSRRLPWSRHHAHRWALAGTTLVEVTSWLKPGRDQRKCVRRRIMACEASASQRGSRMGSVVKKRRKRMAKKKHRKLLRKTRVQRRRLGK